MQQFVVGDAYPPELVPGRGPSVDPLINLPH